MDSQQLLVGLTAVNVMLVATTWTGPKAPHREDPAKVIRAQAIELVDERGQVRAQLHLGADGSGNLRLRDGNGHVRIKLGTSVEGGTGLLLMDQSIEPTLSLVTARSGTSMTLVGPGQRRLVITPSGTQPE
jgi:hypothetical protein